MRVTPHTISSAKLSLCIFSYWLQRTGIVVENVFLAPIQFSEQIVKTPYRAHAIRHSCTETRTLLKCPAATRFWLHRVHLRMTVIYWTMLCRGNLTPSNAARQNAQEIYKDGAHPEACVFLIIFLGWHYPSNFSSVLAFHLWWIACAFADANSCYFADGNIALNFVPYSPNGDGDCCVNGDFCTAWRYCISDSKDTSLVEPTQIVLGWTLHVQDAAWQAQTVSLNPAVPEYLPLDFVLNTSSNFWNFP
jgi:hypothetical protein